VWLTGPPNQLGSRTIFLQLGAVGSHGVLGGILVRDALKEQAWESWAGPAEDRQAPDRRIPHLAEKVPPEELLVRDEMQDTIVHRLGRLGHLNVILDRRLQGSYTLDPREPHLEGELSEVLPRLEQADLIWKSRPPFLLFRPLAWQQIRREVLMPWPFIRDLRAGAASNDGYLRPEDWQRLASLDREQLVILGEHYPDVNKIVQVQVLLRLIGGMTVREQALLARPEGAGWQELSAATRRRLLVLFPAGDAQQARAHAKWHGEERPPRASLYLGIGAPVPRPREFKFERKEDVRSTDTRGAGGGAR
jgi:hypothetical protein